MKPLLAILTGIITIFSLSGQPVADTANGLNGKWYLQPVLPSDTAAGKLPFIVFDVSKQRFTGHTGCNNMSGRLKLSGKSLLIDSNIVTTKMACTGYNEPAFIKSLLRTNGYKFDNGDLILLVDGTELSHWVRKPVAPRMRKA